MMPFDFVSGLRFCVGLEVFGFDATFDLDAAGFAAFRLDFAFAAVGDLAAELFFAGDLVVDFAVTALDFPADVFGELALPAGDFLFVGIYQIPPNHLFEIYELTLATHVPSETRQFHTLIRTRRCSQSDAVGFRD
jgi:hypothetical protein